MLGIIGGSRAYDLMARGDFRGEALGPADTPYGKSQTLYRLTLAGQEVLFLSRHGEKDYSVAAPFVNYRANIYALKESGVRRIVAWSGPGAINPRLRVGQYVLPDDIIDQTRRRPSTFFEGAGWGFIRQSPVFCPTLASALSGALGDLGLEFEPHATYVCTEGPRLETPAEIKMFAAWGGDLVGMTLCPEAFLARELEMCYAAICYVTNYAEGVKDRPSRPDKLFGGMATDDELRAQELAVNRLPEILEKLCSRYGALSVQCNCESSMLRPRKNGRVEDDWHTWITHDTQG